MKRRDFVKTTAIGAAAVALGAPAAGAAQKAPAMPKRQYGKDGPKLSVIGFPGLVLRRLDQEQSNRLVAETVERGVNYFDVAPAYGDAEVKMGPALAPYRKKVFLATKTKMRDRAGAKAEFERSLERLRTDHVELYQLHCLMDVEKDVKAAFATDGVMPYLQELRKAGKVRYLGFSAHTEEAALAAMDRFAWDSILFPISFAPWLKAGFGPKVVAKAKAKGITVLAIKGLCRQRWSPGDRERRKWQMWYQPVSDPAEAEMALRWTLSQPVTAAVPPAHVDMHKLALNLVPKIRPITDTEVAKLTALAQTLNPLFPQRPRTA